MTKKLTLANPETGAVRSRSNVCLAHDAIDLVPGDVLKAYRLPLQDLTPQQHSELMYYEPCCICHRTLYVFMQEGCDYCASGGHGVPSVAEARRQRDSRFREAEASEGRGGYS